MMWEALSGLCALVLTLMGIIMRAMQADIRELKEENKQILINYVHKNELKDQIREIKDAMKEGFEKLEVHMEKWMNLHDK